MKTLLSAVRATSANLAVGESMKKAGEVIVETAKKGGAAVKNAPVEVKVVAGVLIVAGASYATYKHFSDDEKSDEKKDDKKADDAKAEKSETTDDKAGAASDEKERGENN